MKKTLALILALTMIFGMLAGCGGETAPESTAPESSAPESSTPDSSAPEASWPKGAVTIHAASKAGGSTDMHTRFIANAWGPAIDENVVVQNYDSSAVAFSSVAAMAPDGANLLCMHTGIVDAYLTGATDVSPIDDLEIVAVMQDFGIQAFIAAPDAPYNDFKEMIDYAKEHPGELSCAIATKNATHFMWGSIAQQLGVEFRMVEAANETEKLTNVAGGFISLGNCSAANGKNYEADGKVKVLGLAVNSDDVDTSAYPEYKTLSQQGVDYFMNSYIFLFAPAGTDEATLQAMNASLEKVLDDASYQEGMQNMGCTPGWMNLEDSRAFLASLYESEKSVADSLGILAENR
ncbi:MAG: tripartite tricarboxylate transporter substrate binding protein [Candidatus Heteroscillospira sp.]|jgi:tripartite-type tricarboxylate transporter receptor subunit TctC